LNLPGPGLNLPGPGVRRVASLMPTEYRKKQ